MLLSEYVRTLEPSATQAAGARARQIRQAGHEVFDFTLGEPDFNTPEHIQQAAIEAMRTGKTHYTPPAGVPELRKAIGEMMARNHGLNYAAEQVCVSSGCKHTLHTALAALVDPGDEVIIPAPYWVSYVDLVKMCKGKPVVVETTLDAGFRMTAEQLKKAITPKTKLLMFNAPSNPTGAVYSTDELQAIAKVVLDAGILVLSDEIYDRLVYDGRVAQPFATLAPELFNKTLTINGVSKAYAMTGWRIGWTCGPKDIIQAMADIQSQETGNPCSVSQYATLAAITQSQQCVADMLAEFTKRRAYVAGQMKLMPGVKSAAPDGAFYSFFDVSSYFGRSFNGTKVNNSLEFTIALLEQAKVAMVQGSAFGAEGFMRMSFACGMPTIERGLAAFKNWLSTVS